MAHVDLAKEEASEIGREGGRFAGLVAAAVALVIMAAFLAIIGTSLFLGEWLLGSIGWGVLHGVLLFVSAAVALVLLALGVSPVRIGRALIIAVIVAVLTSIVLGLGLLNQAYTAIGDSLGVAVSPDLRPLVVGVVLGGLVGLVIGLAMAVQATANRFVMIAGGIVFGVLVGRPDQHHLWPAGRDRHRRHDRLPDVGRPHGASTSSGPASTWRRSRTGSSRTRRSIPARRPSSG